MLGILNRVLTIERDIRGSDQRLDVRSLLYGSPCLALYIEGQWAYKLNGSRGFPRVLSPNLQFLEALGAVLHLMVVPDSSRPPLISGGECWLVYIQHLVGFHHGGVRAQTKADLSRKHLQVGLQEAKWSKQGLGLAVLQRCPIGEVVL